MDVTAIIKYFDLNEHPFMTSPDPRYLYFSSQVKEALAKCEFMARDRIGPYICMDQLVAQFKQGKIPVLLIDEAQYINRDTLKLIHYLLNFETNNQVTTNCSRRTGRARSENNAI